MIFLRQSTASQEVPLGRFVDSTDGNTEETALTIANTDIKIWKTGATTLANKNSGGATHIANGEYYAVFDATDTDTIGPMKIGIHVAGALYVQVWATVLDEAVYDALFGTTALSTYAGADTSGTTTLLSRIGGAITITSGRVNADVTHIATAAVNTASAQLGVNVVNINAQTATAAAGVTFPSSIASPTNITAATGIVLSGVTHTGAVIPTVSTLTGHTAQTGDTYALANGANGFVALKSDTAAILDDTGTAGVVVAAASKTGYTLSNTGMDNLLTRNMVEAYSTIGGSLTLSSAAYETVQHLQERAIASTTDTVKKRDQSTTAFTLTLDDATNPTSSTRAT